MRLVVEALRTEPFTCLILAAYVCNVLWQLWNGRLGPAWYWFAAGQITFVATWRMGWVLN